MMHLQVQSVIPQRTGCIFCDDVERGISPNHNHPNFTPTSSQLLFVPLWICSHWWGGGRCDFKLIEAINPNLSVAIDVRSIETVEHRYYDSNKKQQIQLIDLPDDFRSPQIGRLLFEKFSELDSVWFSDSTVLLMKGAKVCAIDYGQYGSSRLPKHPYFDLKRAVGYYCGLGFGDFVINSKGDNFTVSTTEPNYDKKSEDFVNTFQNGTLGFHTLHYTTDGGRCYARLFFEFGENEMPKKRAPLPPISNNNQQDWYCIEDRTIWITPVSITVEGLFQSFFDEEVKNRTSPAQLDVQKFIDYVRGLDLTALRRRMSFLRSR